LRERTQAIERGFETGGHVDFPEANIPDAICAGCDKRWDLKKELYGGG